MCRWRAARPAIAGAGNNWTVTTCPAPVTTGPTPIASCTPDRGDLRQQLDGDDLPAAGHHQRSGVLVHGLGPEPRATTGRTRPARRRSRPARPGCPPALPAAAARPRQQLDDHDLQSGQHHQRGGLDLHRLGRRRRQLLDDHDLPGTDDRQRSDPGADLHAGGRQRRQRLPRRRVCTVQTHEHSFRHLRARARRPLANGWTTTACNVVTATSVPVLTCTPQTGNAGNGWVTITCPGPIVTTNVPVVSCTPALPVVGNNYTTITCPAADHDDQRPGGELHAGGRCRRQQLDHDHLSRRRSRPARSASPRALRAPASAGNILDVDHLHTEQHDQRAGADAAPPERPTPATAGRTTTCPAPLVTTNVPVASCTASGRDRWPTAGRRRPARRRSSRPTCRWRAARRRRRWPATRSRPSPARRRSRPARPSSPPARRRRPTSGNSWTATICTPTTTTNVPVASCTPQTANAGQRLADASPAARTGVTSQPVANCTAQAAGRGQRLHDHHLHPGHHDRRSGGELLGLRRRRRQQLGDDHLHAQQHHERAGGLVHAGRARRRQRLHDDHLPGHQRRPGRHHHAARRRRRARATTTPRRPATR